MELKITLPKYIYTVALFVSTCLLGPQLQATTLPKNQNPPHAKNNRNYQLQFYHRAACRFLPMPPSRHFANHFLPGTFEEGTFPHMKALRCSVEDEFGIAHNLAKAFITYHDNKGEAHFEIINRDGGEKGTWLLPESLAFTDKKDFCGKRVLVMERLGKNCSVRSSEAQSMEKFKKMLDGKYQEFLQNPTKKTASHDISSRDSMQLHFIHCLAYRVKSKEPFNAKKALNNFSLPNKGVFFRFIEIISNG